MNNTVLEANHKFRQHQAVRLYIYLELFLPLIFQLT